MGHRQIFLVAALFTASMMAALQTGVLSLGTLLNDVKETPWETPNVKGVASVVIIEMQPSGRLLLQRRTVDYPIRAFASTLCIIGGNRKGGEDPWTTLVREVKEELSQGLARAVLDSARLWQQYEINISSAVLGFRQPPYAFLAYVYTATVNDNFWNSHDHRMTEGSAELVSWYVNSFTSLEAAVNQGVDQEELVAWGYGTVLTDYVAERSSIIHSNYTEGDDLHKSTWKLQFQDPAGVRTCIRAYQWSKPFSLAKNRPHQQE